MAGELFGAPAIIDHYSTTLTSRLLPVVNGLAVVTNDVTVTSPVGFACPSIEKLETSFPTRRTDTHFDGFALEGASIVAARPVLRTVVHSIDRLLSSRVAPVAGVPSGTRSGVAAATPTSSTHWVTSTSARKRK